MTNLSLELREDLKEKAILRSSTVSQVLKDPDGTIKLQITLHDGFAVETVLLTDKEDRKTACVSCQAGCAMKCAFCQTGTLGLARNLEPAEIVEQFLYLEEIAGKLDNIVFVCGHYEGIDQRFIDECVDEELSLGDFVLTGGEIAAMAMTDAICRMVPGVLADPECFEDESHFNGMLEYPQYSRPAVWHGREVPEILLSGNHEKVAQWRRKQSIRRTRDRRPDMYEKLDLSSKQDKKLLLEIEQEDAEK
jgi:hypothetical protein